MMDTFYSNEELERIGFKKYGKEVYISRNALFYHPEMLEIGNNVRIDDFAIISGKVSIGNYTHISQFCCLFGGESGITIEDYVGIGTRTTIYATSNDYSGESMVNPMVPIKYKPTDINKSVKLCRHVVVGTTTVILPGVIIGEGCAVGAMSLCIKSLDDWGIYAGTPVRRIKERSKHILELEAQMHKDHAFET